MIKKSIISFLIGIGIIVLVLYIVDFNEVVPQIQQLSLGYFLLLLLIELISIVLSALKWRLILRSFHVPMKDILPTIFVGYLVNNITPMGFAGGEPVRACIISKKRNIPLTSSAASVIVDLFLEIFPMFLLSGIAIYLVFMSGIPIEIAIFLGIISLTLSILFFISITLVMNKNFSLKVIQIFIEIISRIPILKIYSQKLREDVNEICDKFNYAMRRHMMDPYVLFFGTLISSFVWGLRLLRTYVVFIALGYPVSIDTVIVVEIAVSVLSFLPLLPGSLGIWEGASVMFFVLAGVDKAYAMSATLIDRVLFYLIPSIIGIISALYLGISVSRLVSEKIGDDKIELEKLSKIIGS